MTTRLLLTAPDARCLTQAANDACCIIEVKRGDAVITIIPDGFKSRLDNSTKAKTVDLDQWRVKPREGKNGRGS